MDYKDKRWIKKRAAILRRDRFICQEARRYGKSVEANTVHHIYPVESYAELAFEDWNLISLSDGRHNEMHDRDTHEITEKGKRWQKKREREFKQFYKIN